MIQKITYPREAYADVQIPITSRNNDKRAGWRGLSDQWP